MRQAIRLAALHDVCVCVHCLFIPDRLFVFLLRRFDEHLSACHVQTFLIDGKSVEEKCNLDA